MTYRQFRPGLHPSAFCVFVIAAAALGDDTDPARNTPATGGKERVGQTADGRIVVPTNQVLKPAGSQVTFPGRPSDLALSPNGRWLAVLSRREVVSIEVESGKVLGQAKIS